MSAAVKEAEERKKNAKSKVEKEGRFGGRNEKGRGMRRGKGGKVTHNVYCFLLLLGLDRSKKMVLT